MKRLFNVAESNLAVSSYDDSNVRHVKIHGQANPFAADRLPGTLQNLRKLIPSSHRARDSRHLDERLRRLDLPPLGTHW